jgi:hypothetical protein
MFTIPTKSLLASATWLLLFAAVTLALPAAAQDRVVGEVVDRAGTATVVQEGAPRMLDPGVQLYLEDRIYTGAEGKVRIRLADGSHLTVGPGSELQLTEFHQRLGADGGAIFDGLLELVRGIVRATLAEAAEERRFEIQTRAAAAAARSTEFVVVDARASSAVFVVEGEVAVRSPFAAGEVRLGPGEGSDVPLGEAPGAPVEWGAGRVEKVLDLTTLP